MNAGLLQCVLHVVHTLQDLSYNLSRLCVYISLTPLILS